MLGLISGSHQFTMSWNTSDFQKFRRILTINLEFEGHVLSSSNVLVFLFNFCQYFLLWFGFLFSFFCCFEKFLQISVYKILCLCIFLGKRFIEMFLRDVFTPQKEETMVLGTSFIQLTFIKTIIFSSNCTFKMWCWRRLLRILQTERRSNQSILRGKQS